MKNPVQRISLDRILTSLCPVFLLAAVKEFFVVNDKALMNSGTNYTACVISGDGEGNLLLFYRSNNAFGPYLPPHRSGGIVGDGDGNTDAALSHSQKGLDRGPGGPLHESDHVGGGKDVQFSGTGVACPSDLR